MTDYLRPGPVGITSQVAGISASKIAFLRRVYGLLTASLVVAAGGAMLALHAGLSVSQATLQVGRQAVTVPPLVAFFVEHPFVGMILFLGSFFGASAVRTRPGVNVAALFGATFVSGLYIAPMLWVAQASASAGQTLSAAPVRDAFLLTALGFFGLTAYAFTSKRDFSALGGMLSMGFWLVLGASLLNLFFHSQVVGLAVASVGVLLFGGYILFHTARLLREGDERDPVGAVLTLYTSVLNLFLFLLQILMSGNRRD